MYSPQNTAVDIPRHLNFKDSQSRDKKPSHKKHKEDSAIAV